MAHQNFALCHVEPPRSAFWRDACFMQGFADINIAQSRDHMLVEQGGFYLRLFPAQDTAQHGRREVITQRLWPDIIQTVWLVLANQFHKTKTARIIKCHPRAIIHIKDHMVMFGISVMRLMGKDAGGNRGISVYRETPRHTQMHKQALARRQLRLQKFGPPRERIDTRPRQARGEIGHKGKSQIRTVQRHGFKPRAFHHRGQAAADSFDFG